MRVLTWNIHANNGASGARLERIADAVRKAEADVVLLQEVGLADDCAELMRAKRFAA